MKFYNSEGGIVIVGRIQKTWRKWQTLRRNKQTDNLTNKINKCKKTQTNDKYRQTHKQTNSQTWINRQTISQKSQYIKWTNKSKKKTDKLTNKQTDNLTKPIKRTNKQKRRQTNPDKQTISQTDE